MTIVLKRFRQLKWPPVLLMLTLVGLAGCGDHKAENVMNERGELSKKEKPVVAVKPPEDEEPKKLELTSPGKWLEPSEYEFFRPGRSMSDLLKDVRWKGSFEMATEYQGKTLVGIKFGFFERPPSSKGKAAWAIFVDGKFEKFVRSPAPMISERKIGNFRRLINAYESESVSVADLKKSLSRPKKPRKTDWGLTLVWLWFSKGIIEREAAEEKKREALYPESLLSG